MIITHEFGYVNEKIYKKMLEFTICGIDKAIV